jgi:hypothetical protein
MDPTHKKSSQEAIKFENEEEKKEYLTELKENMQEAKYAMTHYLIRLSKLFVEDKLNLDKEESRIPDIAIGLPSPKS